MNDRSVLFLLHQPVQSPVQIFVRPRSSISSPTTRLIWTKNTNCPLMALDLCGQSITNDLAPLRPRVSAETQPRWWSDDQHWPVMERERESWSLLGRKEIEFFIMQSKERERDGRRSWSRKVFLFLFTPFSSTSSLYQSPPPPPPSLRCIPGLADGKWNCFLSIAKNPGNPDDSERGGVAVGVAWLDLAGNEGESNQVVNKKGLICQESRISH